MKKLGLLVMPLMAVSFLASCGGSKPVKTYNVTVGESDHLNFTTLSGGSLNNTKAYENEDFKFKMKVDDSTLFIVPSMIDIVINDMDPLLEGYTITNISETEAEVTILASKIIGDIVISGDAISNGYYQYEVPYAFGLDEIPTDVRKKDDGDLVIAFNPKEKENDNETYQYPGAENIYIQFDNCPVGQKKQWVSPSEELPNIDEYCSYDNTTGQLTIKSNHIRSNIVIVTRASNYPLLDKLSWQDIEKVSFSGVADYIFYLGEEKTVKVNDLNHKVRIIGFNHDDLASGTGKAGITFEFENVITNSSDAVITNWNDKDGDESTNYDFPDSTLNDLLNNTKQENCIFNKLPTELQGAIKEVYKPIAFGENYEVKNDFVTKLFPLSYREMTESSSKYAKEEGSTYPFYQGSGDTDGNRIKKEVGNSNTKWYWIRSPNIVNSEYAMGCAFLGTLSYGQNCCHKNAIAPAFCI